MRESRRKIGRGKNASCAASANSHLSGSRNKPGLHPSLVIPVNLGARAD